MPLFKKKMERRKSLSRKEISLARLENFRKEVVVDHHSITLGKFLGWFKNICNFVTVHCSNPICLWTFCFSLVIRMSSKYGWLILIHLFYQQLQGFDFILTAFLSNLFCNFITTKYIQGVPSWISTYFCIRRFIWDMAIILIV